MHCRTSSHIPALDPRDAINTHSPSCDSVPRHCLVSPGKTPLLQPLVYPVRPRGLASEDLSSGSCPAPSPALTSRGSGRAGTGDDCRYPTFTTSLEHLPEQLCRLCTPPRGPSRLLSHMLPGRLDPESSGNGWGSGPHYSEGSSKVRLGFPNSSISPLWQVC